MSWSHSGICPKKLKTYAHTKIILWMFLAVLFILVKILKQSICVLVGKWISKLRYVQTMGYYSVLKMKKKANKPWKDMQLNKCILLSERSPCERLHVAWFQLCDTLETAKVWRHWIGQCLPGTGQREGGIGGAQRISRSVKLLCMKL